MRSLGWFIAVSALLITIPRYFAVLEDIDGTWITAAGMGVLLSGGAAYIFHAWAKTKRKNSGRLLVAFVINLAYEPIIITPFVLSRLWEQSLAEVMTNWYAVFWSIVVATAPVVLVGGVVLALSFQRNVTASRTDSDGTERRKTPVSTMTCKVCGKKLKNQKALAGHMNKHRDKTEDGPE